MAGNVPEITGNFTGNTYSEEYAHSYVALDAYLDIPGDTAKADLLQIDGSAYGTTALIINNLNTSSLGGANTDGIQVVQVNNPDGDGCAETVCADDDRHEWQHDRRCRQRRRPDVLRQELLRTPCVHRLRQYFLGRSNRRRRHRALQQRREPARRYRCRLGTTQKVKSGVIEYTLLGRLWNEFAGDNTVTISDGVNPSQSFTDSTRGLIGEVNGTVTFADTKTNLSTFVSGGALFGSNSTTWDAKAGVRKEF